MTTSNATLEKLFTDLLSIPTSKNLISALQEVDVATANLKEAVTNLFSQDTGVPSPQVLALRRHLADRAIESLKLSTRLLVRSMPDTLPRSRLDYLNMLLQPLGNQPAAPTPAPVSKPAAVPTPVTSAQVAWPYASSKAPSIASVVATPNPSATTTPTPPSKTAVWPGSTASTIAKPTLVVGNVTAAQLAGKPKTVFVNIRKHPHGKPQPIGKRRVFDLKEMPDGTIRICIGKDASKGWAVGKNEDPKQVVPFLDFLIGGEKGIKVSLKEAVQYWKTVAKK